ncbi:MAG: hypothetical protein AAF141_08350 [Pseudomonadota bacterium]
MSLDRLMLIVVAVLGALMALGWVTGIVTAAVQVSPLLGLFGLCVVGFAGYIVYRVIAERLGNPDDDKYDRVEK